MRAGLLLLATVLAGLLAGCADRQARDENRALSARMARLETQLRALQDRQQARTTEGDTAEQVTRRAAAGYCASELARDLESYNQDNGRYPPPALISLPSACGDFRVEWGRLTSGGYAFSVQDRGGQVLARQGR